MSQLPLLLVCMRHSLFIQDSYSDPGGSEYGHPLPRRQGLSSRSTAQIHGVFYIQVLDIPSPGRPTGRGVFMLDSQKSGYRRYGGLSTAPRNGFSIPHCRSNLLLYKIEASGCLQPYKGCRRDGILSSGALWLVRNIRTVASAPQGLTLSAAERTCIPRTGYGHPLPRSGRGLRRESFS